MAKNKVFGRRYIVEFKGVTTNDFMPKMLDQMFDDLTGRMRKRYKQLNVVRYTTEDMRTGGASELTPAGIQVNLMYQPLTSKGRSKGNKGSAKTNQKEGS